jgi:hypothetical protein
MWIMEHAITGIGRTFPQHQTMGGSTYDYRAADSVHNIPHCRFADFEPNFNTVFLPGSVRPTDLVSSSPLPSWGLLVSRRFLSLLNLVELPPHKVYAVPVEHRRRKLSGYHFIHFPVLELDLPPSTSLVESLKAQAAIKREIVGDLFRYESVIDFAKWLVSDRLRVAIQDLDLTGMEFSEFVESPAT